MTQTIRINERDYSGLPTSTAIVICLDGSQKEYFEEASKLNLTPNLDKIINTGENLLANSAIPSFTNPNNISIVTGQPSAVHGICGNFFYTPSTGEEVMMNDPQYLRAPTIFQKFYEQGAKIAVITAKDKLRSLLGNGLKFNENKAICFSSEKSDQTTLEQNGIEKVNEWLETPVPEVYSQDLSEFVMKAGVKILNEFKPDIMYLSTTDFIQHKYAPGDQVANTFYAMFDKYIGELNINNNSIIGSHCIINSGSLIEHDNSFYDFSSTGPGVITGGDVTVGDLTHLGIGSIILNGKKIFIAAVLGSAAGI